MSKQTTSLSTQSQLSVNTDTSKVFLWNRRSQAGTLGNSTYAPVTYPEGTVMGRINTTGVFAPFVSGASNGQQNVIGVLIDDYTIAAGAVANVFICDDGDVDQTQLIFQGADTLTTVVGAMQVKDHLKRAGIKLVGGEELTKYDGQ